MEFRLVMICSESSSVTGRFCSLFIHDVDAFYWMNDRDTSYRGVSDLLWPLRCCNMYLCPCIMATDVMDASLCILILSSLVILFVTVENRRMCFFVLYSTLRQSVPGFVYGSPTCRATALLSACCLFLYLQ